MVIVKEPGKPGFEAIFHSPRFKCAFITASSQYEYGSVTQMKCHKDSDEVFILLQGTGLLLTKDSTNAPCHRTILAPKTAYNVTTGTWHYLAISADAVVFVAESGMMEKENTLTLQVDSECIIAEPDAT